MIHELFCFPGHTTACDCEADDRAQPNSFWLLAIYNCEPDPILDDLVWPLNVEEC